MPGWKALCELLLNEDMTAYEIMIALGVKPSRLRRMLRSKRLLSYLKSVEAVADLKAGHGVVASIASAAKKLNKLTESDRPETARRATLDILTIAREIYRDEQTRKRP